MGKHAQTRQPSRVARAAAVSTGTLLLCLCGAGPAFADIGPVPVPQPVDDAVTTVTDAAGLDNPLDDSTTSTDGGKTTRHAKHKHHSQTKLVTSTLTAPKTTTTATSAKPRAHRQTPAVTPVSYPVGGLRASALTTTTPVIETGRAPVTAGSVPAAGQADTAAGAPQRIRSAAATILDGTGGEEGPRVILIGVAAMVLGGLSAGHIKVAQDRLAAIIG